MMGIVFGSVGVGISILALIITVSVTRNIGYRDPLNVPRFWRRALFIKPQLSGEFEDEPSVFTRNQRIAFVANPTKPGVSQLREQAMRACAIRYLPQPMWFYTTEEDPGTGQARQALDNGADVVVACGGDGTVRAVAEAVVGTGKGMGIVPMGTGNLFARNLDIPLNDAPAALRLAIESDETALDVGWIDITAPDGSQQRQLFLVIAGAGLDAEMVAATDDRLKKRLGWGAYFFGAVSHLGSKRMTARITVEDGETVESQMRTVLMANVGRLPAGLQLVPNATAGDGLLDVATLDARGGIVGWTDLLGNVMAQGAGIKDTWWPKALRTSRIDHIQARSVDIDFRTPQKVQVDGELVGRATGITAEVDPGALRVRVAKGVLERTDGAEGAEAIDDATQDEPDQQA